MQGSSQISVSSKLITEQLTVPIMSSKEIHRHLWTQRNYINMQNTEIKDLIDREATETVQKLFSEFIIGLQFTKRKLQ